VLGGKTGSRKTKILQQLKKLNESVIDLEMLANHRGSAFGGIGLGAQPTQEQFENNLAKAWYNCNSASTIWIENESRLVGKCIIPPSIYNLMKLAPILEIDVTRTERAKNIIEEYGVFDKKNLVEKTMEIEKKLGNQNMRNSVAALLENDFTTWVSYLLDYYDKTYQHSKDRNESRKITTIPFSISENIEELITLKNGMME
jgi:tRNA 2-selenouridine synthase